MSGRSELDSCVRLYTELEGALQSLFAATIGNACACCPTVCCRVDLCEEAVGSPFLSFVRACVGAGSLPPLEERDGWLGLHGCALRDGRPPVCYAFVCEAAYGMLPEELASSLRQLCGRLDEVYAEFDGEVDLHRAGASQLAGEELARVVEGLRWCCQRAGELLALVEGGDGMKGG